ncbi:MAG: LCP family protein [Anaerolineales bacterium]|jgi:LCP family protein required for cell wall assembly|nr:LCP family protein [Anaerolineales bacterium]
MKIFNRLDRLLIIVTLLFLILLVGACSNLVGMLTGGSPALANPLVTMDPNAAATATPFNSIPLTQTPPPPPPPTATPIASPTPIDPWGGFTAPVEPSAIEIRRPIPPLQMAENVVNIMVLGSDERPYAYGHRTDTMILISLDLEAGTATLLSFPRDLYVFIPGWRVDRINVADAYGGPERVAQTILYNFGIEVDHTVMINFYGFTQVVDSLGGINVKVEAYLQDECGHIDWSYFPGTYHMDGFTALCYVRMRKTTGDFDRLRRQQETLLAIFDKMLTLEGLSRVPDLYAQFRAYVETDLTVEDTLRLLPLATKLAADPDRIHRYSIDPTMGSLWRVPYSGASVILPEWEAIELLLHDIFENHPQE